MAKESSLDIVSEYDLSTMINATEQAQREIATRYDFQGTDAKLSFDRDKNVIEIEANSELKLEAMEGVLESKFIKQGLDLKFLDKSGEIQTNNMIARKTLPLVKGLNQEKAKELVKLIRDSFPKVKTQIQGEAVRVVSGSKDDLQSVMSKLKATKLEFPISFNNFR